MQTMTTIEQKRLSAPVDFKAIYDRLSPERRRAAEAMRLVMRLSQPLNEAIAERDQHAYRRTLRTRKHAAERLERRYNAITPSPRIQLGNIHQAPNTMPKAKQQQQAAHAKAA